MSHTQAKWVVGSWRGQCHMKHAHGNGNCKYEYTLDNTGDARKCVSLDDGQTELIGWDDYGTVLPDETTAALIAAAPEMYEYVKARALAGDVEAVKLLAKVAGK